MHLTPCPGSVWKMFLRSMGLPRRYYEGVLQGEDVRVHGHEWTPVPEESLLRGLAEVGSWPPAMELGLRQGALLSAPMGLPRGVLRR